MNETVKILLVDDEPRNLDAFEAILEGPNYQLLRAVSAEEALTLLLHHDVAAIVLDIKMPGMSGFELAEVIKGTRKFRQVPILFITAYLMDDQNMIAGYGAGAVDYLTKPVNPQVLRHKVAVFAELFRKTRALAELNDTLEERVKERTADLERSEAALRAADRQKDEFLAILAHELRNPLAPLSMGVDILRKHVSHDAPPIVSTTLPRMRRQLDYMVRLIDDLLDVSRITRGSLELKREHTDLAALVQTAVDGARPFLEIGGHKLSVVAEAGIVANVDVTRVVQILTNLLHNAAKFTATGGLVRVELTREGNEGVIRVIDEGEGIAADDIERVFGMFARIDRPGATDQRGLGIGLALARRLADMHGGSLSASSAGRGHGTTFIVRLPAEVAGTATQPATNATSVEGPVPEGRGRPGVPLDVVVIEDNADIADTLALWVEDLGHRVRVARSGPAGVATVESQRPDLVLCDLGLPDMDGVEVCRRIRALAVAPQPRMVALTGWGREGDRRRTRDAGFDEHLVKPVATEKLYEVIRGAMDARDLRDGGVKPPGHEAVDREGGDRDSPETPSRRVLIVDDNVDSADMLRDMMSDAGHDVRTAHDGASALELARGFLPEVAFLDLGMPVMDGYQLATELRRIPGLEHVDLVALTGFARAEDRARTKAHGFDEHLSKPIDPHQAIAYVSRIGRGQGREAPHPHAATREAEPGMPARPRPARRQA